MVRSISVEIVVENGEYPLKPKLNNLNLDYA